MCGILGSLNNKITEDILNSMLHRGPDSGAIEEYHIQGNSIYFGHRRLAIVELSEAGHQPMQTLDNNFAIIFNGEIYNHAELRKSLPEIVFRGNSDTETILYYLAKYGVDAVKDFNGIFSIGFLDFNQQQLYLIRDHFGVKPLYYIQKENQLSFASEIKPLQLLLGNQIQIDKENVAELLKLRYNPSPDTIYQEIYKLRPGHILKCDLKNDKTTISSYIKPVNIITNYGFSKAVDKYGQLFEEAVKRQLMSDVEIGSLLSGGIDSALVTYFAQKHTNRPIKTYTVGFREEIFSNELAEAQITADFLKTEHHNIIITPDNFKSILKETCQIVEEPLGTTSILPMYYLNQRVSKDVKVVLTGQGADEPLAGYTRYKGEILAHSIPGFIFNLAKPIAQLSKKEKWIRATNALAIKDTIHRWDTIYALFTDDEIKKLIGINDTKSVNRIAYFYNLLDSKRKKDVEAMLSVDLRMNLSDDLLMYTDKVSMNFTIETRVPMLDIELIKFVESLPIDYKLKGNKTKRIHKVFASEILPQEIINRPKKGFMSPTEKWFREDLGDYYIDLLENEKNSLYFELFNKKEVLKIFKEHKSGFNREKQIFTLLSLYYLMLEKK